MTIGPRASQQEWTNGAPPSARGMVRWFVVGAGAGEISRGENVFSHVTAIPGEGHRTVKPGTPVSAEVAAGLATRTVREVRKLDLRA